MLNSNAISRISYSEVFSAVYVRFNNSDDVYCYENVSAKLWEFINIDCSMMDEFINYSEYFIVGTDK